MRNSTSDKIQMVAACLSPRVAADCHQRQDPDDNSSRTKRQREARQASFHHRGAASPGLLGEATSPDAHRGEVHWRGRTQRPRRRPRSREDSPTWRPSARRSRQPPPPHGDRCGGAPPPGNHSLGVQPCPYGIQIKCYHSVAFLVALAWGGTARRAGAGIHRTVDKDGKSIFGSV